MPLSNWARRNISLPSRSAKQKQCSLKFFMVFPSVENLSFMPIAYHVLGMMSTTILPNTKYESLDLLTIYLICGTLWLWKPKNALNAPTNLRHYFTGNAIVAANAVTGPTILKRRNNATQPILAMLPLILQSGPEPHTVFGPKHRKWRVRLYRQVDR